MVPTARQKVLLATLNPAKQVRLRWMLDGLPIAVRTPGEAGVRLDVPEDGTTHSENAVAKAAAWSRRVRGLALASDGGLLVPALGARWNSLSTHRFASEGADDLTRAKRLLAEMEGFTGQDRQIAWVEAVALAQNGIPLGCWEVQSGPGVLASTFDPAQIEPGFWVGSLWLYPALGKSYSQTSEAERAQVGDAWSRLKVLVQGAVLAFLRQGGA